MFGSRLLNTLGGFAVGCAGLLIGLRRFFPLLGNYRFPDCHQFVYFWIGKRHAQPFFGGHAGGAGLKFVGAVYRQRVSEFSLGQSQTHCLIEKGNRRSKSMHTLDVTETLEINMD